MLQADYKDVIDSLSFEKLIYTGPTDSYFDYKYGKLPYRSLKFEHETFNQKFYQEHQQINYPNDYYFTWVVEWKHATGQESLKTTITREYSMLATGNMEKYYPVSRDENHDI
jgi:UDP-galactopyranose mutase